MAKSEIQWGVCWHDEDVHVANDEQMARIMLRHWNARAGGDRQAVLMTRRVMTTKWKEAPDGQE